MDRHRILWSAEMDLDYDEIFQLELTATREGLTAKHANRLAVGRDYHVDAGCDPR
jgi:hypothetical protein